MPGSTSNLTTGTTQGLIKPPSTGANFGGFSIPTVNSGVTNTPYSGPTNSQSTGMTSTGISGVPSLPQPKPGLAPLTGGSSTMPSSYTATSSLTGNPSMQVGTSVPMGGGASGSGGSGTNMYGMTKDSPNWYQLQSGEDTKNYYARTQNQTQSQALAQTQPTGSTGQDALRYGGSESGLTDEQKVAAAALDKQTQANIAKTGNNGSDNGLVKPPNPQDDAYKNTGAAGFSSTVGALQSQSSHTNPAYDQAVQDYQGAQQGLVQSRLNESNSLANNSNNPISLEFMQGRGAVLQNQYLNQQNAYSNQMGAAAALGGMGTAQQSTQQSGLNQAAGYAQPQLGGFNQQYFNPLTGQPTGGGGSGGTAMSQLPQQAQTAIQSYAQQVQNGSMTRSDAEGRLGAYGQPGLNALNEALGPNFNTNSSNASAGTTAVGQQLKAAIPPASQALDALQTAFNALGTFSGSSVPFIQEFAQNAALQTGIGRTNVSNFQGALQEARSRIDAALTGVIGVDAAGKQANALLPDNMTTKELPGKILAAKQYLQNQLDSYTNSGQQGGTSRGIQYNSDGTLKAVSF